MSHDIVLATSSVLCHCVGRIEVSQSTAEIPLLSVMLDLFTLDLCVSV